MVVDRKILKALALPVLRYVQVCTPLQKLQFLRKIGKIVESMETCERGPR